MEPNPQIPRDVASKLIESFWDSFETSTLCLQENIRRPHHTTHSAGQCNTRVEQCKHNSQEDLIKNTEHTYSEISNITKHSNNNPSHCAQLDNKKGIRRQLRKLSKRDKTDKSTDEVNRAAKRCKAKKKLEKKNIKLFGPDFEEPQTEEDPLYMSDLLLKLKAQLTDLKCHGTGLTKQMWLLFATFEEFLRTRYPETAAGIKRYVKVDDWKKQSSILQDQHETSVKSETEDDNLDDTDLWLEDASRLHTSVAETVDWLRPDDECEDWSDDTDRVRKLTEDSEEHYEHHAAVSRDVNGNNLCKDSLDCMNISWYTKVKKIDKSSTRNYRNRTPEKRQRQQLQTFNKSKEIETPVRGPEDLFGESCLRSRCESQERRSRHCTGQSDKQYFEELLRQTAARADSPVTISSGYESDRDGVREADIDSILYGMLPGYKKGTQHRDTVSPPYIAMADHSTEAIYENLRDISKINESTNIPEHSSLDDLSINTDSDVTVIESTCGLNRSRSVDDILKDNGVIFVERNTKSAGPISGPVRFTDAPCKFSQSQCVDSDDEDGTSCNYENLPAALYAQVSPPKPHTVYTPTHLRADPLWESTPMDGSHKPRIINTLDSTTVSQSESSLRSQIRKKIGSLLDEKSASLTPYKSAFRPYNKQTAPICVKTGPIHTKLQDHSIAELRRTNGQILNSHYLCMTQNRSQNSAASQSLNSVLVGDVSVQPATLENTTTRTVSAELSPDSGHGNSDQGSPPMSTDPDDTTLSIEAFRNLKDSRIVHKENLCRDSEVEGCSLYDTDLNDSDVSNIYETIPSDIDTICQGRRTFGDITCQSEHIYCKIGDIPSLLESRNKGSSVPEPPPVTGRSPLLPNDIVYTTVNKTKSLGRTKEFVAPSDIVDKDRYHTYSVADVMRSFKQYAGHLEAFSGRKTNPPQTSESQAKNQQPTTKQTFPKGSFKTNITKFLSKNNKQQSGKTSQEQKTQETFVKPVAPAPQAKPCNFTPGFGEASPFGTTGPLYSGRGIKLAAIKKTLSFQDLSPTSTQKEGNRTPCARQMSLPGQSKNGSTQWTSAIHHHKQLSLDFTPTVIDGAQSYHSTPTDVTSDLIISPPSAFKGSPQSPDTPVYENVRDLEIMRQNRRRAIEEGSAYPVTPLRRTKSAMSIQWDGLTGSKEIFC